MTPDDYEEAVKALARRWGIPRDEAQILLEQERADR